MRSEKSHSSYLETDNYYNNNGQYHKKNCRYAATADKERGKHS